MIGTSNKVHVSFFETIKYHHQHYKEKFGCMNIDLIQKVALEIGGSRSTGAALIITNSKAVLSN
jgi:hypothetical protein